MKKLIILLISILITHTCFANVFRTNNSPFTIDKGKFDLSIGTSSAYVPSSADVIVGIPITAFLGFGYGKTDKLYIQMGVDIIAPSVGTALFAGAWYQWLGDSNENPWSSTAKLSADLTGNVLISNSFGYTVKNWLSIYSGVQITADANEYSHFPPLNKSDKSKSPYSYEYGAFAGIRLNIDIFSDQLIYIMEAGYLNMVVVLTEKKQRFWVPIISHSLSYAF